MIADVHPVHGQGVGQADAHVVQGFTEEGMIAWTARFGPRDHDGHRPPVHAGTVHRGAKRRDLGRQAGIRALHIGKDFIPAHVTQGVKGGRVGDRGERIAFQVKPEQGDTFGQANDGAPPSGGIIGRRDR